MRNRSRSLAVAVALALPVPACALAPAPAPTGTRAPPPKPVYAVWEFDTIGELEQLLAIKSCEGWTLGEVFARGEKIIAVIEHLGPAPEPDPACRPAP